MHKNKYFRLNELGMKIKKLREKEPEKFKKLFDKIEVDKLDTYDYSPSCLSITCQRGTLSQIESGRQLPSPDFLFAIHKLFNISLDFLVFSHNLPEIEEFLKIYKRLNSEQQGDLVKTCFEKSDKFVADRGADDDILDFRFRLNEVKQYKKLTFNKIYQTVGMSKNTVEKYHSKRSLSPEELGRMRNSALSYLIRFCENFEVSLDFLLEGTFWCDGFPCELSSELRRFCYQTQLEILSAWLAEAKKFLNF